jgi:hypothetical protein
MADESKITLQGTKTELMQLVPQLAAFYQLLENLDFDNAFPINENFDPGRKYHPLVHLHFREDSDFKPGTNQPKGRGQNRTKGDLTFRLMSETTQSISKGELTTLGQRIKQVFGSNNGYIWNKGKEMYCYADWSRGYQLQILARSEAQARDLVTKILSLQNHNPQWKYLTKSQSIAESERYPTSAQTMTILGEQVTLPLLRPNAEARFRYAQVRVSPLIDPIVIYDRTGKKAGALVR